KTVEFFVNSSNETVGAADSPTRLNSIFRIQLPESNLQVRSAWFQWGAASDADAALSANVSLNSTSLQLGRIDLSVGALLTSFSFISNMNASTTGVSIYSINNNNEVVYNLSANCITDGCWSMNAKLFITYQFNPNSSNQLKTNTFFINFTNN